jgi:hypothetical protein
VIVIAKLVYGLGLTSHAPLRIIMGQFSAECWTADLIAYNWDGSPLLAFKPDCSLPEYNLLIHFIAEFISST